ncbi:MAG: hypothetical protein M3N29_04555 [Chloroflexota bacterium]|nr:hypothetical protein [Chloroflexota bacterium]
MHISAASAKLAPPPGDRIIVPETRYAKSGDVNIAYLVSSTVGDLVAGWGIEFADRGAYALKGVPGEWRIFTVVQ